MARRKPGDSVTYEEAATARDRAVAFLRNVVGDETAAENFENMSVEDYIAHKGLVLENPAPPASLKSTSTKRRVNKMATNAQLQEDLDRTLGSTDFIWDTHLVTDSEEYDRMSDSEKLEACETALEEIGDELNQLDSFRYPIDDDDQSSGDDSDDDQ